MIEMIEEYVEKLNSNLGNILPREIYKITSQGTISFQITNFNNRSYHIISSMYTDAQCYYIVLGNYSYGGSVLPLLSNDLVNVTISKISDGQCTVYIKNLLGYEINVEVVII